MIRLLRFIKGCFFFSAQGGFAERFVNLCRLNGICLWDMENDGVKVSAFTFSRDKDLLLECAEKSGMDLEVKKEKSLKALILRYKFRLGMAFGVIGLCFLLWFLSLFIWSVEVKGLSGVKLESFTEILSDCGVKTGVIRSKINARDVENELLRRCPEFKWVAVNVSGSKAEVEIELIAPKSSVDQSKKPANIVASKNGKIVFVNGHRGINEVKKGDYVSKGSLLISGLQGTEDENYRFVRASGEVYALTENLISAEKKFTFEGYLTCNQYSRYFVKLLFFRIPTAPRKEFDVSCEYNKRMDSKSGALPLGYDREDVFSVKKDKVLLTSQEALLEGLYKAVREKREEYNDTSLEKITYTSKTGKKKVVVSARISCVEDIGEVKIFRVKDNE